MICSSFELPKNQTIRISVIIPTYNRAKYLEQTIDSFLNQKTTHSFEIIVADNNSTDNTKEIIQSKVASTAVPIIYHKEVLEGAHYARNSASIISSAELLYFTDDDMVADEYLLEEIVKVFQKDKTIGVASGKVLPKWEVTPPDWVLKYCINGLLSLANYGETEMVYENDPGIWSCHLAIRRDVFFATGGFNPDNAAGVWIGDGETGLNIKIKSLGYKFGYTPTSVTNHIIPSKRTTQTYLNNRLANQGNCDSYTDYRANPICNIALIKNSIIDLLRIPKFYLKSIMQKWNRNDHWHLTRAYSYYYKSKVVYSLKLLTNNKFKALVLKNDWLSELQGNLYKSNC